MLQRNRRSAFAFAEGPKQETPQPRTAGGWRERLMGRCLSWMGNPPVVVEFDTGERVTTSNQTPVATIRFDAAASRAMSLLRTVFDPYRFFGEAYGDGHITVEGDLVAMLEAVFRSSPPDFNARRGRYVPDNNTTAASKSNIHQHYDLGNAFYRLWLDERMVYTCAYFQDPAMTLEAAQTAKLDHVCRKLRLAAGERVIEAGCGWGAMALHMAKHYGVRVRAFNISTEQLDYARAQANRDGLSDRVEFIEDDYRNLSGKCDAFVSIGMLEHVGVENYPNLGQVIDRCLTHSGRGLIHTIGRHKPTVVNGWLATRIFPGAEIPALSEIMQVFEHSDFNVLDVENIRLHYAETLRHWLARFDRVESEVTAMFDARFVRLWRLYLAGSLAAFTSGWTQLFQVLFNRYNSNEVPWTRAYQYDT